MRHDIAPAIGREYSEEDVDVDVISEICNRVTFHRGLGDTGYKIETVEKDCPSCSHDRMVRRVNVNPEIPDQVFYWCLSPTCPHFVSDQFSYLQHRKASSMAVAPDQEEKHV